MKKDEIRETLAFEDLTEEEKSKRHILGRLYGPVADIMNPTRNGRKYSEQLWENVFESPLMQEKFKNKVLYGELGHPEDRTEIDMEKVAICMPEPPKKDKQGRLIGYFDILDTPNGRILKTLCDYGSTLGISSRGTGDLEEDEYGEETVNPDTYDCECFDVVLVPAVESARLTFTESINKKDANLKRALREDLNNSSEEDKKIMKETLDNLNIKINEEEEIKNVEIETSDEVEADEVDDDFYAKPSEVNAEGEEDVELSYEDKIRQLYALTLVGDEAPDEEKQEAFVQAFKTIFPEECFNQEGCTDKEDEETHEETVVDTEEADDVGSEEIIDSLKEAVKDKAEFEAQVKQLQEQIAVSDAKVTSLNEQKARDNQTIARLTKIAKNSKNLSKEVSNLKEQLITKNKELEELHNANSMRGLKEALKTENGSSDKIKQLNEAHQKELMTLKEAQAKQLKDATKVVEDLKVKLTNTTKVSEGYKNLANQTISRYINLRAKNLAIKPSEITSRLPKSYNIDDVDRVCEALKTYEYQTSKIPFDINKKTSIKIKEAVGKTAINPNSDDYVDEDTMYLANSIK